MAFITLDEKKLKENYEFLDKLFVQNNIQWSVVTKMLCGNPEFLTVLLKLGMKQICDSRVSNLKTIKTINPTIETVYIKPPAKRSIPSIVKYADISMNTEIGTIQMLSDEAVRQGKIHKIIIMIELGELREGVLGEAFIDFYSRVFQLSNIEVIGVGANLSCLYGVLPNSDKLIQLSLYKQVIEAKFNSQIPLISGGTSVTIPLVFQRMLPKAINHFRVGETLFLGTDVYNDSTIENMHHDVFKLSAEIIELIEKPTVPMGDFGTNLEGTSFQFDHEQFGKTSYRAIIDLGLLDVEQKHIEPVDKNICFVGASSDMLVIDLGENKKNYKVGDLLEFKMDYMGTLRIINSRYIGKKIRNKIPSFSVPEGHLAQNN
jgi:ornithine racemase